MDILENLESLTKLDKNYIEDKYTVMKKDNLEINYQ
jgi:hypothetical protein